MRQAYGYEIILLIEDAVKVFVWSSGSGFTIADKDNLNQKIYSHKLHDLFEYEMLESDYLLFINAI